MITVNSSGNPLSPDFAAAMQQPSVGFRMALYSNGQEVAGTIKRAKLELGAGYQTDDLQTFGVGQLYTTQFEADIYGLPQIMGQELEVRVGVLTGQSYEYVTVAYATITEQKQWQGLSHVAGKGRMGLMNVPHGLTGGDHSPAQVAAGIVAATGISVAVGGFTTAQNVPVETGGTCRDALASMCTRLGGYACEIGDGISVLPFSSAPTYTIPEGYVVKVDLASTAYAVDGLTVEAAEESFDYGTGRVHIQDPTATAATSAATWGNIQGYSFMPGSLGAAIIDPRVTPADTILFSYSDGTAHSYSVPARGISITYDGGYFGTYSAAGLTAQSEGELVEGPLASKVADAYQLAQEAEAVAQATGQHFWDDGSGAHVTEATQEEWNTSHSGANSLWNSLGMLFRNGLTNLLAIITSNTGGSATGISIYDGQGNEAENIVASFTNDGVTVGASSKNSMSLGATSMVMYDNEGATIMEIAPSTASSTKALVNRFSEVKPARGSSVTLRLATVPDLSVRPIKCEWDVRVGTSSDQYSFSFTAFGTTMSFSHAHCIMAVTPNSDGTVTVENASTQSVALSISDFKFTYSGSGIAPYYKFGNSPSAITGAYGLAHGSNCYPQADNSMASGEWCVAQAPEQHVLGRCNAIDNTSALIIGNGTGSTTAERSNAMTVDWNGNEVLSGGLTLGSPLTVANGGTGATSASDARNALNVPSVASQTNQLVNFSAGSGSTQVQAIYFNVANSSSAYEGKRLALLIRQDGISLYNGTDNSTVWTTAVSTSSPTLTNATATAFELRKSGSVVNLQIQQLKVGASLADGSTVSLGSGIIPSGSRPAHAIGFPLVANVAGKGAGCWLYITAAGNVTLYNRSGSALGTNTNLYGNTTWVI